MTAIQIGRQLLIQSDVLDALRRLPAASIDVVVTSPPYNLAISYGRYADDVAEEKFLDWLAEVAREIARVMKDDASFFLNFGASSTRPWLPFELARRLRGLFDLQNHIVWVKALDDRGHFKPVAGDRFLHRCHEQLFHLTKDGKVALDRLAVGIPYADKSNLARRGHAADLRCRGNTWFIPYDTIQDKSDRGHPAPFPVALPDRCIRLAGKASPVILDPFCGSGSSMVAAQRLGHRGIGIDLDPAYLDLARRRVERAINA